MPRQIGDAQTFLPQDLASVGPHAINGAFYVVTFHGTPSGTSTIRVYKAVDPTAAWTAMDTGNEIAVSADDHMLSATVDGTSIHVVGLDNTTRNAHYGRYDALTDTWVTVDTAVVGAGLGSWFGGILGLAVRSNGDIVLAVDRSSPGTSIPQFFVRSGGTWGPAQSVALPIVTTSKGVVGQANAAFVATVLGDGDRVHFFYLIVDAPYAGQLWHQSLAGGATSTAGLDTAQTVDSGLANSTGSALAITAGGATTLHLVYPTGVVRHLQGVSGPNPTLTVESVNATSTTGYPPAIAHRGALYAMWTRTSDHKVVYSASPSGAGGDWSAEAVASTATPDPLSAEAYARSGERLAFVYATPVLADAVDGTDWGPVYYDEVTLTGAAVGPKWL